MAGTSAKIFFIDDSRDDFEAVQRAFKKNGLENGLEYFFSGADAIKRLRARAADRPCLILLDLNMPGMDGRDVLSSIKLDKALKDIPVVVLTHAQEMAAIKTCYALGANAYLVKPDNPDRLAQNIKKLKECWLESDGAPQIFDDIEDGAGSFSVLEQAAYFDPSARGHGGVYLSPTEIYGRIMGTGARAAEKPPAALTAREKETLLWIARGKSRWETGAILCVSEDTVKTRLDKIRAKLGAVNTTHAIAIALLQGLLLPEEGA